MNEHKILSVVITMFNVEKYVGELIQKICLLDSQANIEFILVDDGSTDTTILSVKKILSENSFKSLRLIGVPHNGVSSARNVGMNEAHGKYIHFIDGDDLIDPVIYVQLLRYLESSITDVLLFNWINFYPDGKKNKIVPLKHDEKVLKFGTDYALSSLFNRQLQSYVWNFIAKRSVWQDVSFPVGRNWEDYSVVYRIFNKSTTFEHINSYPILYRRREGSISTTRRVEILQKNVNDIILASEEILDFFGQTIYADQSRRFVISYLLMSSEMLTTLGTKSELFYRIRTLVIKCSKYKLPLKVKITVFFFKIGLYGPIKKVLNIMKNKEY